MGRAKKKLRVFIQGTANRVSYFDGFSVCVSKRLDFRKGMERNGNEILLYGNDKKIGPRVIRHDTPRRDGETGQVPKSRKPSQEVEAQF